MNLENIAKQLGLIATLTGAGLTALNIYPLNIIFLNLGAGLYLFWSIRIRDWNLAAVNGGILTIYAIGVIIKQYI
jgi:hypothetical protein